MTAGAVVASLLWIVTALTSFVAWFIGKRARS
jgi:hypothetical protein